MAAIISDAHGRRQGINDTPPPGAGTRLHLGAIVPAGYATALEDMSAEDARELLEDLADAAAARISLAEPGEDVPAEQFWAELGLA
jgi:hypothetical protein